MQGNLNMANHSIINLKDPQPSDSSYAASVNFVNNTVNGSNVIINDLINKKIQESEERSIEAVQQEKVMVDELFILDDDDIKKVAVVNKEFHKVNQQTYQFKIDYDSSIGYYRKIVNCYRRFAELREALAGQGHRGERLIASSAPGHKHLRQPLL